MPAVQKAKNRRNHNQTERGKRKIDWVACGLKGRKLTRKSARGLKLIFKKSATGKKKKGRERLEESENEFMTGWYG